MFDWPVGTTEERQAAIDRLPGKWINSNPYGQYYEIAKGVWNYHDGVDLNLNSPSHNLDFGHEVKAIADGKVLFMGDGGGSWGNIIDILHEFDGGYIVCRYGHVSWLLHPYRQPQMNDRVVRGQSVCKIGNIYDAYGKVYAHLHWNISKANDPIMIDRPNQWCGGSRQCVLDHYVDPIKFIIDQKNRVQPIPEPVPEPEPTMAVMYVNNPSDLNMRLQPAGTFVKTIKHGTKVSTLDYKESRVLPSDKKLYTWQVIRLEDGTVGYVADKYLSSTPPV